MISNMEYIYSAMLLHSAGKEITDAGIKKILKAAVVEADDTRIKALTSSLEGINIEEAISTAVSVAPSATTTSVESTEKKKEEKKEEVEEKDEEEAEEEAAAGLGALFG